MVSNVLDIILGDCLEKKYLFSEEYKEDETYSSLNKDYRLKLTLIKRNPLNNSFSDNQIFLINHQGYQDEKGICSKNGSVRIGR